MARNVILVSFLRSLRDLFTTGVKFDGKMLFVCFDEKPMDTHFVFKLKQEEETVILNLTEKSKEKKCHAGMNPPKYLMVGSLYHLMLSAMSVGPRRPFKTHLVARRNSCIIFNKGCNRETKFLCSQRVPKPFGFSESLKLVFTT